MIINSTLHDPAGWARDSWHTILTTVFNPALAITCGQLNLTPWTFNFTSDPTLKQNFILGEISPDLAVEEGTFVYPLMALSQGHQRNRNYEIGYMFSGDVTVNVDVHVPFVSAKTNQDFEHMLDAVNAALTLTFEIPQAQVLIPQGLVYGSHFERRPTPVIPDAAQYRRTVRTIYRLQANIPFPDVSALPY